MKVSTRRIVRKNANWQKSIIANYVTYLEEAQQHLEKEAGKPGRTMTPLSGPLEVYENIGRAMGLVRHVTNGLRAYFLKDE